MNTIPKELQAAYDQYVSYFMHEVPFSEMNLTQICAENIMAYRTTKDEIRKSFTGLEIALEKLQATQDQLVQQEKLASLGLLTAGIAHEIKYPLNFVTNFSEVSLEMVEEAREELRRVTEDGGPGSAKAPKGRDWEQHPTKVKSDKINSPLSKGDAGGYEPKLTVRTKSENVQILIEIEDNGPGIPEDIKDKILQPFNTTKKGTQGKGLGLSITNDIVKAHGG